MPLTLQVGGIENDLGGFGMHPNADISIDRWDAIALPHFFTFADLNSHHPEFFQPSFMRDVVPTADKFDWTFSASSNSEDRQAIITWNDTALGNNPAQLFLYDATSEVMIDMKKNSSYSLLLSDRHDIKFFYSREGSLSPDVTNVIRPYPNPFSTQVVIPFITSQPSENIQIILVDVMGKQVRSLLNETVEPGYHEATWEGSDDFGSRVPQGVYMYRFTSSGGSSKNGKIVFR